MMQAEEIEGKVNGTVMGVLAGNAGSYVVGYADGEVSITSANSKSYISYIDTGNSYTINTIKGDPKVSGMGGLLLYVLVLKALSEGKSDIFVNPPISLEGQKWCDRNKFNHADHHVHAGLQNMIALYGKDKPPEWAAMQMGTSIRVQGAIWLYFGLKEFIQKAFRFPA